MVFVSRSIYALVHNRFGCEPGPSWRGDPFYAVWSDLIEVWGVTSNNPVALSAIETETKALEKAPAPEKAAITQDLEKYKAAKENAGKTPKK